MTSLARPARILMIEDNVVDRMRSEKALSRIKLLTTLTTFERAEDALEALAPDSDGNRMIPDLILLDLNLPGMSGQEFLEVIKHDEGLRRVPVAALTSSSADRDLISAWGLGVSSYIVKPFDLEGLLDVMQELTNFYFEVVVLPPETTRG